MMSVTTRKKKVDVALVQEGALPARSITSFFFFFPLGECLLKVEAAVIHTYKTSGSSSLRIFPCSPPSRRTIHSTPTERIPSSQKQCWLSS